MPHTVILVFELMYIYYVSNSRSKMDFMNVDFASIDKPYETLEAYFWLRLRSPRSHSVRPSIRAKVLILLISDSYLQADFKVTSG